MLLAVCDTMASRRGLRWPPGRWWLPAALAVLAWTSPAGAFAPLNATNIHEDSVPFADSRAALLGDIVTPTFYVVKIEPDYQYPLQSTTDFKGSVTIDFALSSSTRQIDLIASRDITFVSVSLRRDMEASVTIYSRTRPSDNTDVYRITTLYNMVATSTYVLSIEFEGKFQESGNRGFYKSTYQKEYGATGVLFTTQFQPGHASKVFPCFDEPKFRAPIQLSIRVPQGYSALSNTLAKPSDETDPSLISFSETVSMPTYLLAFVVYEVSSFVPSIAFITDDDVEIRTWARKDAVENKLTDYSQDVTFKILRELEGFTEIPYKKFNDKIDQVAVPHFAAGAMENWGLITYREARLLYNESSDSEATRKSVAAIIAHELTHQWFGNLVTTSLWDTTWLNEGFARFFQYYILSRIQPTWRMMDQLLLDQQMAIFVTDATAGATPLTNNVITAEEVSKIFNSTTYSKGASIVRMLMHVMGEENFKTGLQEYLSRGPASVTPIELFSDLENHLPSDRKPEVSLEKAMESWTTQPGFPVLHIERDYSAHTANLTQYRYFTDGTIEKKPTTYYVPITWSSKEDSTENFLWLNEDVILNDLPYIENWILVHANGYYRVNYDEGNWLTLSWTLARENQDQIAPADRAKLVDDALALARVGHLHYRILGYLLRYLPHEKDVLPWAAASRGFKYLDIALGNSDPNDIFHAYLRHATAAAYAALDGFSQRGDPIELILRSAVLELACRAGDEACLAEASRLLHLNLYANLPLDPNLKDVIRCYGTRVGNNRLWEEVWHSYVTAKDSTERTSLLTALACKDERNSLYTFFQRMFKGEYEADPSETRIAFQKAINYPKGVAVALDFYLEMFPQMRLWLPEGMVWNILEDIIGQLSTEEQQRRVSRFLEDQLEIDDKLEDEYVDDLLARMKTNVGTIQNLLDSALSAFSDATPKEEVKQPDPVPTEPSGAARNFSLLPLVALLAIIFTYGEFSH